MIHVELHHRDDLAEFGDELAEHAGLVHAPQRQRRIASRGKDRQEKPVRLLAFAKLIIDERQRAGDDAQRIRVQFEIIDIGDVEEPDQIDRVVLENIRLGERNAPPVLDKFHRAGNLAHTMGEAAENAGKARHVFRLAILKCCADNAGQVAHIFRHEEIVLHETLDGGKARARLVTQRIGDFALNVERKALFRLAGDEVHLATDSPEKIIGLFEQPEFRP
ncbi:hypothetical protein D3C87_424820 [compost metagenome]